MPQIVENLLMKTNSNNSNRFTCKIVLSVLVILLSNLAILNAQDDEYADSLFRSLSETNSPEEKFRLFLLIKDVYADIDYEKALRYAKLAFMEAENANFLEGMAEAYFIIGDLLESEDVYNEAIENYIKSYEAYSNLDDKKGMADLSYSLADIYKKKGFYHLSMEKSLEGLSLYESLSDSAGLSDIYNCMGSLYKYQDEIAKSLEYYNRSLELRKLLNDIGGTAQSYNNIGVVYAREGSIDLALDYYERALELHIKSDDIKNQAIVYNNIANNHLTTENFKKAYEYILKSLELNNSIGYTRGIANQTQSLGRYYWLMGDLDLALENFHKAFDIYLDLGRLEYEKNITARLSDVYSEMGDNKKAYEYLKMNQAFSDSIFNIEKMKNIATLELEFNQLREREIHDLKEQKQRAVNIIIGISLFFSLIIVILLFSRQRIKNKEQNLKLQNIELEKRHIENDLEQKQKELAAGTIYRVKKNEMLNEIISRLTNSLDNLKDENIPIIKNIIEDLKNSTDIKIWDEFELRFLKVHEGFYENISSRYPELTTNEKRLSAFLRLDFSTKEISSITQQSPHSINIARTRLRKKLELANTDTNLSSFLAQF